MRRLRLLCPQSYEGAGKMVVRPCTRCSSGWSKERGRCEIVTGAEHLEADAVPTCPLQDRCLHQVQAVGPCAVRSAGMVCESALIFSGMSPEDAFDHPLSFNADVMA